MLFKTFLWMNRLKWYNELAPFIECSWMPSIWNLQLPTHLDKPQLDQRKLGQDLDALSHNENQCIIECYRWLFVLLPPAESKCTISVAWLVHWPAVLKISSVLWFFSLDCTVENHHFHQASVVWPNSYFELSLIAEFSDIVFVLINLKQNELRWNNRVPR